MNRRCVPALLLAALLSPRGAGQGLEYVQAHYTKFEYRIPMRDGVRLFTAVYAPKDDSKPYPILLTRTPYSVGPYGSDRYRSDLGPWPAFGKEGYVFVYQDVRGRYLSEGEFVNMRPQNPHKGPRDIDESSDTYDTIDWLVKHVPNNNGRVGQYGISYPGFYTAAGMIDAHPALKAASPQAPVTDWFVGDDFHHNGALFLPHSFNFLANFGRPRPEPTTKSPARFEHGTPDGYDFFLKMGPLANADARYLKGDVAFWTDIVKHGNYDEFWQARNLRPHLKDIKPAVMTVGGWFDAEDLFGALETYKCVQANHPPAANHLVMGPWSHGGWSRSDGDALGPVRFNAKTAVDFREKTELPFFEYHLKGKGDSKLAKAIVFETGTNRWRHYGSWPPDEAKKKSLYFQANGRLKFDPPPTDGDAFDEYVSDPARPVPYQERVTIGMDKEYMVADQRFASRRPDVLAYATDPLPADVTIAGPIDAELIVSTTGTDSDWVVKLIDVYPDDLPPPDPNPTGLQPGGYQQLVRGEPMRGKFRNGFDKPEPFELGKPTAVTFTMPDVCHTFRSGHRMMVQVQSSWFPLVDRNPQTFVDIYAAKPEDFRKATQRVYRSSDRPSRLTVRVQD
ncbi:MAG TPA: CocE/NonD family hydrolase [Gemmataceae bacterium]|nr:CocE/NonD family hydrolase [Gemmataceae bacterium]